MSGDRILILIANLILIPLHFKSGSSWGLAISLTIVALIVLAHSFE